MNNLPAAWQSSSRAVGSGRSALPIASARSCRLLLGPTGSRWLVVLLPARPPLLGRAWTGLVRQVPAPGL